MKMIMKMIMKMKIMKKNNSNNKTSKIKICSKYKDKAIRGTSTNWAYKKCMKQPENRMESCKTLPPSGWGMQRYFCE